MPTPFVPTTLHGDTTASSIPPYLSFILSYGGKLTPFTPASKTLKVWRLHTRTETHRLEKVLLWSLFHTKYPKENFFDTFPHKALLKASGVAPPKVVLDKLGAEGLFVTNKVCEFQDLCRFALSDIDTNDVPVRGVCWTPYKLEKYFAEHCVVACDKDGDHITMSLDAYCLEQKAHMVGLHTCGRPVYEKLSLPSCFSKTLACSREHMDACR